MMWLQPNDINTCSKKLKLFGLLSLLLLFSLACGAGLPLFSSSRPTPAQPALAVEVTVVYLSKQANSTVQRAQATLPPAALLVDGATPLPTPVPTDTPSFKPTATPTSTNIPSSQPTSISVLTSTRSITTPQIETAADESSSLFPGQVSNGSFTLIELPDNLSLPVDVGRVEFKWIWNEVDYCGSLPDGQGFEVKIWPDLPGYTPLGVADVSEAQEKIVCDPKSGTRSFEVGNLRNTPGVQAVGAGQFRWQIALVELTEPFTQIAVSESRTFQLPPDPTTPTPTPTLVPRITPTGPDAKPGGEIILIELQNEVSVPPADETIEVKWRWIAASGCELPPPGYGFEVRIWPEHPDFHPMGAMGDARESQKEIYCDPANGIRSYTVPNFKNAPGVKPAGAGRFYWDVILFKEEPYTEVILSETRIFVLPGVSKLDQ